MIRESPSQFLRHHVGTRETFTLWVLLSVICAGMVPVPAGHIKLRQYEQSPTRRERMTRVADDAIQYRFTVEDPSTWARAWTAELPMLKTKGPLFEHACHEGNYGLYNTLVGARLEDKKSAEAAAKKSAK